MPMRSMMYTMIDAGEVGLVTPVFGLGSRTNNAFFRSSATCGCEAPARPVG